ncbi:hypothetical protein EYF80_034206 [Liparis tanakae]|uniref:Uncharacterized protein n=1 Tax=Liparis tanakae TaxID=230148 RepID=A0A4Z2GQF5_9TELE|nr:hypothetical protein EYF80_034206 [Liparis tanakae]
MGIPVSSTGPIPENLISLSSRVGVQLRVEVDEAWSPLDRPPGLQPQPHDVVPPGNDCAYLVLSNWQSCGAKRTHGRRGESRGDDHLVAGLPILRPSGATEVGEGALDVNFKVQRGSRMQAGLSEKTLTSDDLRRPPTTSDDLRRPPTTSSSTYTASYVVLT